MRLNLSTRTKFRLSGPDRVRFLNGQVTNQIDQNLEGRTIPACVCTLKGKVESLIYVTASADGESLLIDAPSEQRESLFERLDRYLIADDCEWADVTDDLQLAHTVGTGEAGQTISRRFGVAGVDEWISSADSIDGAEFADALEMESARIEAGIPKWGAELTGNEFPAEVNLDRLAVDFHKGCYLGQEIVSRIESVGRLKKGLRLVAGKAGAPPLAVGSELFSPENPEKAIGTVTSAAFSKETERWVGLAVLPTSQSETKTRLVSSQDSGKLSLDLEILGFQSF